MTKSIENALSAGIRVMLVEDHAMIRKGLAIILSAEPDIDVAAQVETGKEAVEQYRGIQPDVTLMDLRLPGLSGIDVIAAIRSEFPKARIVVLTSFSRIEDICRCIRAGAAGYVIKDAPVEEIIRAVRRVHGGGRHFSAEVAEKIAGRFGAADLAGREMDVLRLMAEGKRNKEIAQELNLGMGTVKFHVSNVLTKLGASDRTEAVIIALRRGLADI